MSAQRLAERFAGDDKRVTRVRALADQDLVTRDEIAATLADAGEVRPIEQGETLILEDDVSDDVYFILAGVLQVRIGGRPVAKRARGTQVGDYSVLDPQRPRTATLTALKPVVVLKVPIDVHRSLLESNADMALAFARQLLARMDERNALIRKANEQPEVFVISSSEQAKIASEVQQRLQTAGIKSRIWSQGTFHISDYPLDALEEAIRTSDFTISIVAADDVVVSRGIENGAVRDNVQIEYGLSVGALGRKRSIILYDTTAQAKLSSDQAALTYVPFQSGSEDALIRSLEAAAATIADHVRQLGPHREL